MYSKLSSKGPSRSTPLRCRCRLEGLAITSAKERRNTKDVRLTFTTQLIAAVGRLLSLQPGLELSSLISREHQDGHTPPRTACSADRRGLVRRRVESRLTIVESVFNA